MIIDNANWVKNNFEAKIRAEHLKAAPSGNVFVAAIMIDQSVIKLNTCIWDTIVRSK